MNLGKMFKKNDGYVTVKGQDSKPEVPDGLLKKCNMCKNAIYTKDAIHMSYTCPKCHGYFRMPAYTRIESLVESGTFEEWDTDLVQANPLEYDGYEEKKDKLRVKTGLKEAVVTGCGYIGANKVVLAVCDGRFMMASMGQIVGEKITRAVERATKENLPVIIFACSGGARMQEGIVSLMQMAKTSAALKRHSDSGNLYISVLTDPTTGGVTASFAMLGDFILAEPGALIGFAGPRVIEQTIGEKLPEGFQRAEFLLEHGFIDMIVTRDEMKEKLKMILDMHRIGKQMFSVQSKQSIEQFEERHMCQQCLEKIQIDTEDISGEQRQERSPWEKVELSRKQNRPRGNQYIDALVTDFIELHGDRYFSDDRAIMGGIGYFNGIPVTVIAGCKGIGTKNSIYHNFGMPSPEGYRKALRLMKQAEKFHRPVICFVDTPGAFCGLEAEERGQGEAIARNLFELSSLQTPIISFLIGEGGSGGALATAVADEVWVLENAIYSILSPEGYASILWKDSALAKEAAQIMRITSKDLLELGIVEGVIAEPQEFNEDSLHIVSEQMELVIRKFLDEKMNLDLSQLCDDRYRRFRCY